MFYMPIKSQISSTKIQINLKLKYSMTKTIPTIGSHPFANSDKPVMIPMDMMTVGSMFGILNLNHCDLFEI